MKLQISLLCVFAGFASPTFASDNLKHDVVKLEAFECETPNSDMSTARIAFKDSNGENFDFYKWTYDIGLDVCKQAKRALKAKSKISVVTDLGRPTSYGLDVGSVQESFVGIEIDGVMFADNKNRSSISYLKPVLTGQLNGVQYTFMRDKNYVAKLVHSDGFQWADFATQSVEGNKVELNGFEVAGESLPIRSRFVIKMDNLEAPKAATAIVLDSDEFEDNGKKIVVGKMKLKGF